MKRHIGSKVCGFIAQLVEHRTGIAEVMGSNPVEALIFFRLLLSNCLNWKTYCDDHTSLSFNIIYLAQVSIIYADENVYTFKMIASGILIDEKKSLPFFRNQFLGLFQDSD